jgi:serine/threonine-protein kinase RsbW
MRLAMTLSLPQQPASVTRARNVLNTLLNVTEVSDECRGQLAVLISEACTNAIMHAPAGGSVDITITIDDHMCVLEVGNPGTNHNGTALPTELPDPLTVSGRGLPLIAALADTAAFIHAQPGRVLLRITKQLRC